MHSPTPAARAAIATVWALLTDTALEREAVEMCTTLTDPWSVVTSDGLQDAAVHDTAGGLLDLVTDRLRTANPQLAQACDIWRARLGPTPVRVPSMVAADCRAVATRHPASQP